MPRGKKETTDTKQLSGIKFSVEEYTILQSLADMAKSSSFLKNLWVVISLSLILFPNLPPVMAQEQTDLTTDLSQDNDQIIMKPILELCATEINQKIETEINNSLNLELLSNIPLKLPLDLEFPFPNPLNNNDFNHDEFNCHDYIKVSSSLVSSEPSLTVSIFNCKNHNAQGCLIGSFSVDAQNNSKGIQAWQQHQSRGNPLIINTTETESIQGYLLNQLNSQTDGINQTSNLNFTTIMWQQNGYFYGVKLNNNNNLNAQEVASETYKSEQFNAELVARNNQELARENQVDLPLRLQRLNEELEDKVSINKITEIRVFGSTVFSQAQLNQKIQPFLEKEINDQQTISNILADAEAALTQLYLENNYVTSQAKLVVNTPEAKELLNQGIGIIRIIEGSISDVKIEGADSLHGYIMARLEPKLTTPVNSVEIEDILRVLRNDPQFESVEASLKPTREEGKSQLVLTVVPKSNFSSSISIDNYSAPSVGSERYGVNLQYNNFLGLGDQIRTFYSLSNTGGAKNFELSYLLPVDFLGGSLFFRANPNWSMITQAPFDQLGITGEKETYEISYQHPLIKTSTEELNFGLGFTYENGQTFIFDQPSPFGLGPNDEGISTTSVLHFTQNYINRSSNGIWILQSRFNLGLDLFGATQNEEPDYPDGEFISWLGQVQRLQPLGENHLLIIQGDLQLTPYSLLGAQQYGIGGGTSVRGYRSSVRSGDNGFRFSIEDQITVLRNEENQSILILAPFFDLGTIWNNPNNPNELLPEKLLIGAGLGLEWRPISNLSIRFDYGYPFTALADDGNNLQDEGFYFQLLYQPK